MKITRTIGLLSVLPLLAAGDRDIRLIDVAPGHFHAAEVHTRMIEGVSNEAHIYSPLGPELNLHLEAIAAFNSRVKNPTSWALRIFAGTGYLDQLQKEPPGNIVVLSGRNSKKIDVVLTALRGGQHVLVDKPWILEAADLPKLEQALHLARRSNLAAVDGMTLRYGLAYQVLRELVRDPAVFGQPVKGTPEDPAVQLENGHAILKFSDGKVRRRPGWFFDIGEQGEGIADVGTHLVDLALWTLFSDRLPEAKVVKGSRMALFITGPQFAQVTGEVAWPPYLQAAVRGGVLSYFSNNDAMIQAGGVNIGVKVRWKYESAAGGHDTYLTSYRGTRATVQVKDGTELTVAGAVGEALRARIAALKIAGLRVVEVDGGHFRVQIPQQDEQEDFVRIARDMVKRIQSGRPAASEEWELSCMLLKYRLTTASVAMGRQ